MKHDSRDLKDLPRLWREKQDARRTHVTDDGRSYRWFDLQPPRNATHYKIVPTPLTPEMLAEAQKKIDEWGVCP